MKRLVTLIVMACCCASTLKTDAGEDGGLLLFAKRQGKLDQLLLIDQAGAQHDALTDARFNDYFPAWSPDGRKIAFTSNRTGDKGHGDIYVMDADGSGSIRITAGAPSRAPSTRAT